jgi:hypothetical protein
MIEPTRYYEDFLRYFQMAALQQNQCNVCELPPYGMMKHMDCSIPDPLMKNVELYDVVERKYAGFSQIVNDCFYGWTDKHPYWKKMEVEKVTTQRIEVATSWSAGQAMKKFGLSDWLYLFILHRVTGSAINYATKPTGYHNTILPVLSNCSNIKDMTDVVRGYKKTFYTSVGYQFPAFPKPPADSGFKRGGDYFLCEYAPKLAQELARFLYGGHRITQSPRRHTLREVGDFMLDWNTSHGLRRFKFQYSAVVADIADWFPEYVHRESSFYYGSNAVECIKYLATPKVRMKEIDFLDAVMKRVYKDTGSVPYNAEDVCCDYIRYVENYVRPGADYDHLDLDNVWNTSMIQDHPFGRQKGMLELGLVKTFNGMSNHPSDDYILKQVGWTAEQYKTRLNQMYGAWRP